jgi:leucyl aminopeptidase
MDFSTVPSLDKRKKADLLVLPFWKGNKGVEEAVPLDGLAPEIKLPVDLHDFKGKEGEVLFLYPSGFQEKRIALLGLGASKNMTVERLRRAYSSLIKECLCRKILTLNLSIPEVDGLEKSLVVLGIAEGMLLTNYVFENLKGDSIKEEQTSLIKSVCLAGASAQALKGVHKAASICEAVYFARDLINGNADDVTPQALVENARSLAKRHKNIKTTIFDKKRIVKEKMGLLLAVNRGSVLDPAFIILEYKGDPKSKDLTVVVGKGVTYDTGGLSLKPTSGMLDMKCDMSGAATALGTIYAAAKIGLKKNITAVIPTTENSIGSKSYKPGDVYISYSGKTVEIDNTDAEGRLILADALAYVSQNLNPSRIIDFATLTGAIIIALGEETTGMMSNNDELAAKLTKAGEVTFERVWRMPLYEEYKPQLKSDIADLKNTGGREASSITAALFLQDFVGKFPWAHLDIAGTAHLSKPRRYNPKHGTGVGIRLMIEFLENQL